jgi:hypothetical protein
MTSIKKFNEHDVLEDFIENKFYWINDSRYSRNSKKDLKFLKSLNLTMEQYSELATIMEDYGLEKYGEGCNESDYEK